jgi:alpha-beta hydrolase superfamily lysophospholipase
MNSHTVKLVRGVVKAVVYGAIGAVLVLVTVFIVYLNSRPDLEIWHLAELDEEFSADSGVATFAEYLALEERLFGQLDELVYATVPAGQRQEINRYSRGSLSDPERWPQNWNRSFELPVDSPKAGVLLLHGMSDSPYSLRHLGERLHAAGAHVVGLRMPGHGTAPSGLLDLTWQDMLAAVRLAMAHLAGQSGEQPLYIVGYSTGAALAVLYALDAVQDSELPQARRLVLLSPAIGVTPAAALSVWQGRLGHLLGLEKLAWNAILPEYDPFKYGSFAINAGDVVYRLTLQIQQRITALGEGGALDRVPPILAFSSIVDATVSTPDLVEGLFERLPAGGHELVLFDINRRTEIEPVLKSRPEAVIEALRADPDPAFTLSVVMNRTEQTGEVVVRSRGAPGEKGFADVDPGLSWPEHVYSLAHIALPFPADDPLYGGEPVGEDFALRLGRLAMRGERGVLRIPASDMLRQRWNPFYPYLEKKVLNFVDLGPDASVPTSRYPAKLRRD